MDTCFKITILLDLFSSLSLSCKAVDCAFTSQIDDMVMQILNNMAATLGEMMGSSERYEGAVKTVIKANVCMGQKRRGKAYYHRVWRDGNTCGSVSGKGT